MGGLGSVSRGDGPRARRNGLSPWRCASSQPVLACLAAQYAGWNLSNDGYFAMGSGPARALARVEPLFATLAYRDTASSAVLVLETARTAAAGGRGEGRQGDRACRPRS